jgi:hypothetical protein
MVPAADKLEEEGMAKKTKNNSKKTTSAGSTEEQNGKGLTAEKDQIESITHDHLKLQQNFSDEICYFMKEIKAEIEWLDEHCQTEIDQCKSQEDLFGLGDLRNFLCKTREELRSRSYRLSKSDFIVSALNQYPYQM